MKTSNPLGTPTKTQRNFPLVEFVDTYDQKCSLQASSVIGDYDDSLDKPGTSCVWLGVDRPTARITNEEAKKIGAPTNSCEHWLDYIIPDEVRVDSRMHLNREQVEGLIRHLRTWLDEKEFET